MTRDMSPARGASYALTDMNKLLRTIYIIPATSNKLSNWMRKTGKARADLSSCTASCAQ